MIFVNWFCCFREIDIFVFTCSAWRPRVLPFVTDPLHFSCLFRWNAPNGFRTVQRRDRPNSSRRTRGSSVISSVSDSRRNLEDIIRIASCSSDRVCVRPTARTRASSIGSALIGCSPLELSGSETHLRSRRCAPRRLLDARAAHHRWPRTSPSIVRVWAYLFYSFTLIYRRFWKDIKMYVITLIVCLASLSNRGARTFFMHSSRTTPHVTTARAIYSCVRLRTITTSKSFISIEIKLRKKNAA